MITFQNVQGILKAWIDEDIVEHIDKGCDDYVIYKHLMVMYELFDDGTLPYIAKIRSLSESDRLSLYKTALLKDIDVHSNKMDAGWSLMSLKKKLEDTENKIKVLYDSNNK